MTYRVRDYLVINNQPVESIHVTYKLPRVHVTLDEAKWDVSLQLADSGSVVSVLITPKKKDGV